MSGVVLVLVVMLAAALLHAVMTSLMMAVAHVPIEEVGIGLGPKVFGFRVCECLIRLNLVLPIGSYVKLHEEQAHKLGRYSVAAMSLVSPCLTYLLIAVILIGADRTYSAAGNGLATFFMGSLTPWSTGTEIWQKIYIASNQQPVLLTIRITFAIMGILNLLPLPPMPGYLVLKSVFADPGKTTDVASLFETVSILGYLILQLSWIIALVFTLISSI